MNEPGFDQSLWQQVNRPGEATVNTPEEDCDRILLPPLSYTEVVCELKPEKLKHYRSV